MASNSNNFFSGITPLPPDADLMWPPPSHYNKHKSITFLEFAKVFLWINKLEVYNIDQTEDLVVISCKHLRNYQLADRSMKWKALTIIEEFMKKDKATHYIQWSSASSVYIYLECMGAQQHAQDLRYNGMNGGNGGSGGGANGGNWGNSGSGGGANGGNWGNGGSGASASGGGGGSWVNVADDWGTF